MMNSDALFGQYKHPAFKRAGWSLCVILFLISLFTLGVSPLPWYDEVDFASITIGFAETGKFMCTANDLYFTGKSMEVLYYGPVYFVINSVVHGFFGSGIIQFRILNFVAGILCIVLFVKLFERLSGRKSEPLTTVVFSLLMLSDYTYVQDMHSGRMDMVGLLFVLAGLLMANPRSRNVLFPFFLSGVFIAAGLLTTPRVYFLTIPYYLYLLYICIKEKQHRLLTGIVIAVAVTCLLYLGWIWMKFGTVDAFITYQNSETSYFNNASEAFFMPNANIPLYQLVYYILLGILLVAAAVNNYKALLTPANGICLATIAFFLCFAGGSPIYMCLVTGFIYLLAMNLSQQAWPGKGNWIMAMLLLGNIGLAGYKYVIVLSNLHNRSARALTNWVKERIPAGSKVVGDDKYYYEIIRNKSAFQYMERGGTEQERAIYHTHSWKAGYLLTGDTSSTIFRQYQKEANLIFAGEYSPGRKSERQSEYVGSYHGYLFRFVR
jgi:4-amino-4-deoxy-L-arabinose transferase-like glycosyltransferase